MDKDTRIELLKILGMVVILVLLIIGIVWMNKEDVPNETENSTSDLQESDEGENTDDNTGVSVNETNEAGETQNPDSGESTEENNTDSEEAE